MIAQLVLMVVCATSIWWSGAASAVLADNLTQPEEPAQSQFAEPASSSSSSSSVPDSSFSVPSGSDRAVNSASLPVKYWGNSFSLKFHRPSCPFAKAMSAHHVMFFNFRKQAVDSGQVPCRYCLPPNWTTVRATILHQAPASNINPAIIDPKLEPVKAPAATSQQPD